MTARRIYGDALSRVKHLIGMKNNVKLCFVKRIASDIENQHHQSNIKQAHRCGR